MTFATNVKTRLPAHPLKLYNPTTLLFRHSPFLPWTVALADLALLRHGCSHYHSQPSRRSLYTPTRWPQYINIRVRFRSDTSSSRQHNQSAVETNYQPIVNCLDSYSSNLASVAIRFDCSNKFQHQVINAPWLTDYCTNSLLLVIAQYARLQSSPLASHPVMQLFPVCKSHLRLPQSLSASLQLHTFNTLTLQCLLLPYPHLISASARE